MLCNILLGVLTISLITLVSVMVYPLYLWVKEQKKTKEKS